MELYQKMYAIVCGAVSDAIDLLPDAPECERARLALTRALEQAEELYLAQDEA